MQTELLTLCVFANAELHGKLNILGARCRIFSASVPAAIESHYVAARLMFTPEDEGEKDVEISILNADGDDVIEPHQWRVNFQCEGRDLSGFMPLIVELGHVALSEFGDYDIVLRVGEDFESKARLHLIQWNAPPPL